MASRCRRRRGREGDIAVSPVGCVNGAWQCPQAARLTVISRGNRFGRPQCGQSSLRAGEVARVTVETGWSRWGAIREWRVLGEGAGNGCQRWRS